MKVIPKYQHAGKINWTRVTRPNGQYGYVRTNTKGQPGVTDTNVSGVVNEYNFGPNVPNPKSMWNTLDFQEGACPLAYNRQENENNFT